MPQSGRFETGIFRARRRLEWATSRVAAADPGRGDVSPRTASHASPQSRSDGRPIQDVAAPHNVFHRYAIFGSCLNSFRGLTSPARVCRRYATARRAKEIEPNVAETAHEDPLDMTRSHLSGTLQSLKSGQMRGVQARSFELAGGGPESQLEEPRRGPQYKRTRSRWAPGSSLVRYGELRGSHWGTIAPQFSELNTQVPHKFGVSIASDGTSAVMPVALLFQ